MSTLTKKEQEELKKNQLTNAGKGRPKGSKNKFTLVKEELLSIWSDAKLKDKWIKQLNNDEDGKALKNFTDALVRIMPKEDTLNLQPISSEDMRLLASEMIKTVPDDPTT